MKFFITSLIMFFAFQSAQAEILCVDDAFGSSALCKKNKLKKADDVNSDFANRIRMAVDYYSEKNCLEKDGLCIRSLAVDYCDMELKVCNVFGDIKYDTGTMYVYRVIFEIKEDGFVDIKDMTKTDEFGYPN